MNNIFYNYIFESKINSFINFEKILIDDLNSNKISKTELGNIFEYFNYFYFKIFSNKFNIKNCWRQKDLPLAIKERLKLKDDQGADGVIETNDNKFFIYQTKFKSKRNTPTNNELKKSVAESKFADGLYLFTNAYDVSKYVKKFNPYLILFNDLEKLDEVFFDQVRSLIKKKEYKKIKYIPAEYQVRAINNIVDKFKERNIGKYISACGTGKTITSLWIKEKLRVKKTLFVVPSVSLIKQTVEKWLDQRTLDFNFFCVVSNIGEKSSKNNFDYIDIDPNELGVPYSTKVSDIVNFIKNNLDENIVIFSTYHSLNLIYEASTKIPIEFDIIFYDEAHRTAGIEKKVFSLCFDRKKIQSKKKLFMTATPKIIRPKIKKKAEKFFLNYYSMDDSNYYGEVFEEFSFREAIKNNAIVDYEIIIQVMPSNNEEFSKLDGYTFLKNKKISNDRIVLSLGIEKLYKDFNVNKTINFSSTLNKSKQFIKDLKEEYLEKNLIDFKYHIGSDQSSEDRKKILSEFKLCNKGIISNARCLTEGIDVPTVDGVIFSDKKESIIDIVQAVGRCLRKDKGNPNKIAKIFIPIILGDNNKKIDFKKYSYLFEIIEALKAHDKNLVDEINKIHLQEATGNGNFDRKIKIIPHKDLNINEIKKILFLQISKLNRGEIEILKKKLRNKKNKSIKVEFQICRYKIDGLCKLINKGVNILKDKEFSKKFFYDKFLDIYKKKDHNIISHMKRVGILEEKNNNYKLNTFGLLYLKNQTFEQFKIIVKNNFLIQDNISFFPYIMSIKILNQIKTLNELEFLYGIYICKNTSDIEIQKCIERIKEIRNMNISLEYFRQNINSLEKLISKLNIKFKSQLDKNNFELKDFLKLGRLGGEFKYFGDHITTLWKKEFKFDDNKTIISF
jgi:predicted helicase